MLICAAEYRGRTIRGFLMYLEARMHEERRKNTFEMYVTDALKIISENTAKIAGGSVLKNRYIEVLRDLDAPVRKEQNAEEILMSVIKNAGLEVRP